LVSAGPTPAWSLENSRDNAWLLGISGYSVFVAKSWFWDLQFQKYQGPTTPIIKFLSLFGFLYFHRCPAVTYFNLKQTVIVVFKILQNVFF
jgi:hypothetical protein